MHSLVYQVKGALKGFYPDAEALALTKLVLVECLGFSDLELYGGKDKEVFKKDLEVLSEIIGRLKNYEPIQYIIGTEWFGGLSFEVNEAVLIPRPETLELVEWIEEDLLGVEGCRLLDIGTGSGCIAISLASRLKELQVEAWDISEKALDTARKNADKNEVKVAFTQKDVLAVSPSEMAKYHVIVSNPPYITEKEKAEMEANVLDWEPSSALFVPDDDPLLFYRKIAELGLASLNKGGALYFEINRAYGQETLQMLKEMGYSRLELRKDLAGNERMIKAVKE